MNINHVVKVFSLVSGLMFSNANAFPLDLSFHEPAFSCIVKDTAELTGFKLTVYTPKPWDTKRNQPAFLVVTRGSDSEGSRLNPDYMDNGNLSYPRDKFGKLSFKSHTREHAILMKLNGDGTGQLIEKKFQDGEELTTKYEKIKCSLYQFESVGSHNR